jgi:hypothetical protein
MGLADFTLTGMSVGTPIRRMDQELKPELTSFPVGAEVASMPEEIAHIAEVGNDVMGAKGYTLRSMDLGDFGKAIAE